MSTAVRRTPGREDRQAIKNIGKIVGGLTLPTRRLVMEEALRHVGEGGEELIARRTARNLGLPQQVVDACIVISYLELRSRLAAVETGVLSAVHAGIDAGKAVWREAAGEAA